MNVLILGATGFLGRQIPTLLSRLPGFEVQAPPPHPLDLAHAELRAWNRA